MEGLQYQDYITFYKNTWFSPDDGTSDEAVLDGEHVWVLLRVGDGDVGELDVEVLVDRVEGAADGEVVLQLDHDVLADQRLEERVEEHNEGHEGRGGGGENVVVPFKGRKVYVYQGSMT